MSMPTSAKFQTSLGRPLQGTTERVCHEPRTRRSYWRKLRRRRRKAFGSRFVLLASEISSIERGPVKTSIIVLRRAFQRDRDQ
jgi:hypothetical protein